MHIVCEEKVVAAKDAFRGWGNVTVLPAPAITPQVVNTADILIGRSPTRLNAALLDASPVQFVASATAGTDHVDFDYLAQRGLSFAHAPGCNAESVVEYVLAAIVELAAERGAVLRGKTLGIVGAGQIGSRLIPRAEAFGLNVLVSDPPLAAKGASFAFAPLPALLSEADILTLHVPLVHEGDHPTHHLLGPDELATMKPDAWLINACRGPVIDNSALLVHLEAGRLGACVLDVWEGEPEISLDLLRQVDIATPHIAGHSFEGKLMGTVLVYKALEEFLGIPGGWDIEAAFAASPEDHLQLTVPNIAEEMPYLLHLTRQLYPIRNDDAAFRTVLNLPADEQGAYFRKCRKEYPRRRSFGRHEVGFDVPEGLRGAVLDGLLAKNVMDGP